MQIKCQPAHPLSKALLHERQGLSLAQKENFWVQKIAILRFDQLIPQCETGEYGRQEKSRANLGDDCHHDFDFLTLFCIRH